MWDALALNRAGMAMDLISWRKAVSLWAIGRAVVIAEYEDRLLRSPRFEIRMPSIIQCMDMRAIPRNYTQVLPLTRRNLWGRDEGCCVYCGDKVSLNNFTIDHVIPQSQGGQTVWENVVTACASCNNRKGNRRPKGGEWRPSHGPKVPRLTRAAPRTLVEKLSFRVPHPSWRDYIYWSLARSD